MSEAKCCEEYKAKYEEGMSAGKTLMHVAVSGDNSAETVMRIGHVSKGDEVTVEFAFSFLCGVRAMSDTKRCIAISDAWTTFAFHAVNMHCNSVVIDDEPLLRGDGPSRNTWTARPRTMEDAAWSKGGQSSLAFETCETLTRPVVLCQPLATGGHALLVYGPLPSMSLSEDDEDGGDGVDGDDGLGGAGADVAGTCVTILIDVSGSMAGEWLVCAVTGVKLMLQGLPLGSTYCRSSLG
jgi:hypothetical protein